MIQTTDKSKQELILIIDDEPAVRSFIKGKLVNNYNIREAENGEEGLSLALKLIPDLIVTDVIMPNMDGLTLTSLLKKNSLTNHIPVIILTAVSGEHDKIKGLETGADDYLIKPFSAPELITKVNNLINLRKTLREKFSGFPVNNSGNKIYDSKENQYLNQVISIIENNLSNTEFSAEQLCIELAISVSQLNRKLNAIIGKAAGQLIRSIRFQKAVEFLKAGDSIKDVAWKVGYTEQTNFTAGFKKHFGITPLDFIKK
jgi:YesN/AraC family two-component response regulator